MMGTGEVSGGGTSIAAKSNGIGSKNFGLRSLFLFGDQIYIRSNGQQTLLDRFHGTYEYPIPDSNSATKNGISIEVPYRAKKIGKLEVFGTDQEDKALSGIIEEFTQTMLKLARAGKSDKSLRELNINSTRCERKIIWKQSVKEIPCRQQGIHLLQRSLRLTDSRKQIPETIQELEWQRTILIPPEHRNQGYPSYFKVAGGRIRLSVSMQTIRGRPVLNKSGLFYYPIGAGKCYTGTALSAIAPFEMNQDRSGLVPLKTNRGINGY